MSGRPLRALTWNLFHARDGYPGLGPGCASVLLGRPVVRGGRAHLNRKWTAEIGELIAGWRPDVAALQEVPTAAVRPLARRAGMAAVWTVTGPLIGPRRLRDALAARNPDLWRGHEGNANVLLLGPRLRPAPGGARSVRLNPPAAIAAAARRWRLGAGELLHYVPEVRRLVMTRVSVDSGGDLVVGCVHCHNARDPRVTGAEILRAAAAVAREAAGGAALLAGDLNVREPHPALAALARAGWGGTGGGLGIDRILHRGLEVAEPARRLDPAEREIRVPVAGVPRLVRLSDHDPVVAAYAGPTASASRAGPPAAR